MAQPVLLAYPFRVFFLLTAVSGALAIIAWLAMLAGWVPLPVGVPAPWWHAHAMLYGFVPAAAAGFLLTAMPNWTGVAPPRGTALCALAALWGAGRLAMLGVAWLPGWLVATVDLAFLPTLAAVALRMLVIARNYRHLPIVAILLGMATGNALMHAAFIGWAPALARPGELVALDLIALLIAIIGGRIVPAFTRNWLNRRGADGSLVRSWSWLEATALGSLALLPMIDLIAPRHTAVAALAATAALLQLARLGGWQGWRTGADGLVWILHLGYLWLPVALGLRALSVGGFVIAPTAWMHALGAGAMGTMIIGVMARVSVGHTGRGLILRPGALWMFALVTLGALLRVAAGLALASAALYGAGLAWAGAFLLFIISYGPVLWRPRVDGKPG
jgi:uncharacterized protein involved in response to NO